MRKDLQEMNGPGGYLEEHKVSEQELNETSERKMKQQQEHVKCRLVRSAGSRALPARRYLRYPRGGAPALIPQSSLPAARAWARAETARRRRFPFPRADAGVGRRGLGARACAGLRPGCPRSGAGRGRAGRGGGLEVIPEPPQRLRPRRETESGRRPWLWRWRRRRQRDLGPEARGRAVGPRNEVSAGPVAEA